MTSSFPILILVFSDWTLLLIFFARCQSRTPQDRPTFQELNKILTDFYYTSEIKQKLEEEAQKNEELNSKCEDLSRKLQEKV